VDPRKVNWRKKGRTDIAQPAIDAYGFSIWNNHESTCYHMGYESTNDYTLSLGVEVHEWKVLCKPTLDDHQYITYSVMLDKLKMKPSIQRTTDYNAYRGRIAQGTELLEYGSAQNTRENATRITDWLTDTIKDTTIETPVTMGAKWWSSKLQHLKASYGRKMAKARRCRNADIKRMLFEEAYTAKKEYTKEIFKAKEVAWKSFITTHTAWGRPYKVVVKTRDGYGVPPGLNTENGITNTRTESEEYLLKVTFPSLDIEIPISAQCKTIAAAEVAISHDELAVEIGESLRHRSNKSSPGSDNIRWKHVKILHRKKPKLLTDLLRSCLRHGVFPNEWKEAFVSFIPKKDKPPNQAGSYRPICLLSCLGKLLETIIKNRLKDKSDNAQYGFRRGKSTEDCMYDMMGKLDSLSGICICIGHLT